MKKLCVLIILLMVAMVSFAQQQTEQKVSEQKVTVKENVQAWLVVQEFKGSYQDMEKNIQAYINEFFKQGLVFAGTLCGVYYNSPREVKPEDLKWAIGFEVNQEVTAKEPLKKVEINCKTMAVYTHVGPYSQTEKSYNMMLKYIEENGYKMTGPIIEKYLDDPSAVKPEELRTEILIPIEKK